MAVAADYVVLIDKSFALQTGHDIDMNLDFDLRTGFVHSEASILQFVWSTEPDADHLSWNITLNGVEVVTFKDHSGRQGATHHEIVNRNITKNNTNHLVAKIIGNGTGTVGFSDMFLLARRSV